MPDRKTLPPEQALEGVPATAQSPKLWRTGLLVAGSALFGGIAIVLWNRRVLIQMRSESPEPAVELPVEEDAVY